MKYRDFYLWFQNLCNKLWMLIELSKRNIFCYTIYVFWLVVLKKTLVLCYDFIFILQVGKKLQEVFKVCALYLITLFTSSHRAIACRTLANMPGLCLIWSNAINIRSISSCLVLTGLMYTILFTCLQRKKSRDVRSGDLGGHATGPPLPIHFSL